MDDRDDPWLAEEPLPDDPFHRLDGWLSDAFAEGSQPNPHGIALATVDPDGAPSVRWVLCKAIEADAGAIVFYTDRESRKGRALAHEPRAAAAFYFSAANRQARVEGRVVATSEAESDAYFASRPLESRLGAWLSHQSEPVASREALVAGLAPLAERLGVDPDGDESQLVERPPRWGGYRLRAEKIELWHSRRGRIHDRAVWIRAGTGRFEGQRLQP